MSMKPAVFWGQVSSGCQAATGASPPLNCILCSRLASQVRENFLHLFLCCSTLLSRRDELSINKWHMINHALFSLTARVKWRSAVPQESFFSLSKLFLFFYVYCVFLWAKHFCPFSRFHQGFTFVAHIKFTERCKNEWDKASNNARLPPKQ